MNRPKYVWIYDNRQGSEYDSKYVLNIIQNIAREHSTGYWVLTER